MYLQDFLLDVPSLINDALRTPRVRKTPNTEEAMRAVGDAVQKQVVSALSQEINEELMTAIQDYEMRNGAYGSWPSGDEGERSRDDYESGMDDVVEAVLEPRTASLSADWLGKNTIDTRLWESTDDDRSIVERLAMSAASEIWKQLTYEKTRAQMLSNAGVLVPQVESALAEMLQEQPQASKGNNMADATELDTVISKIKARVGIDFDVLVALDDFDMILEDDDDILSNAAAARLGISPTEKTVLQMAALTSGDGSSQFCDMITKAKLPTATATKKAATAAKKAEKIEGALPPVVLEALKTCGTSDTAMAEALGVSRSTYLNYIKGKTSFEPDGDQYKLLRSEVVQRLTLLHVALAALDGTEALTVA